MLLQGLSEKLIRVELQKHFTDEELDEIESERLTEIIAESDTLDELIATLEDYFVD